MGASESVQVLIESKCQNDLVCAFSSNLINTRVEKVSISSQVSSKLVTLERDFDFVTVSLPSGQVLVTVYNNELPYTNSRGEETYIRCLLTRTANPICLSIIEIGDWKS